MPLNACRHIRKMRGGAQAHLLQTEGGQFYVVKFRNNPQHRRILINEWVAGVFLRYLQVSAPETALIHISADFLAQNPGVSIQLGTRQEPVQPGWHFGSRYPGDPDIMAVYDFLPDTLLRQVTNLGDFIAMLVVDKWMANADGRQSIFFRARLNDPLPRAAPAPVRTGFIVQMIDHGFAFNGPHWDFPDAPMQGLYHRHLVYEQVRTFDDFQPWLDQVVHFPEDVVDEAYRQIPLEWLDGEDDALERLLEALLARRRRVPELIARCRDARPNLFPNWVRM